MPLANNSKRGLVWQVFAEAATFDALTKGKGARSNTCANPTSAPPTGKACCGLEADQEVDHQVGFALSVDVARMKRSVPCSRVDSRNVIFQRTLGRHTSEWHAWYVVFAYDVIDVLKIALR